MPGHLSSNSVTLSLLPSAQNLSPVETEGAITYIL